jgi:hypothetical protein
MADQRFFNAYLIPGRTRVAGKLLKPFSLKHRIFLEAIDSPFMQPDREIAPADLIIALKICADETIDRPSWQDKWLSLRLQLSKDYLQRACLAFVRYTSTADTFPQFYERKEKQGAGSSNVPWQLSVICNLVRHGITYTEAMTMPEAKAVWLSTVFSIQSGAKIELLTTDDEALMQQIRNQPLPSVAELEQARKGKKQPG